MMRCLQFEAKYVPGKIIYADGLSYKLGFMYFYTLGVNVRIFDVYRNSLEVGTK